MSILIRGMEMCERCNDQDGHWSCPLFGSVYPYGFFCKATLKEVDDPFSRQPWCPLIPVPPHGDLIDRDALKYKKITINYDEWDDCFDDGLLFVMEQIDNAPTIIEAEKEEVNDIFNQ